MDHWETKEKNANLAARKQAAMAYDALDKVETTPLVDGLIIITTAAYIAAYESLTSDEEAVTQRTMDIAVRAACEAVLEDLQERGKIPYPPDLNGRTE